MCDLEKKLIDLQNEINRLVGYNVKINYAFLEIDNIIKKKNNNNDNKLGWHNCL
jgi:hypothetical protein